MSGEHLLSGGVTIATALLLAISTASGQEITEPIPSTPNPGGSIVAPGNADGVVPAETPPAPPTVDRAPRRPTPMTAADLQTWQQIAALHEEFVRSQVTGGAESAPVSRTDPNRQRLQQLWERLAEIERELILTGAAAEATAAVIPRAVIAPRSRIDLDEVPDPLTATNQRVPSTEVDKDQHTARALAQEDRSPPGEAPATVVPRSADPAVPAEIETVRRARPRLPSDVTPEANGPAAESRVAAVDLWQEFIEIRRQILMAEIAAARTVGGEQQ